MGLSPSVCLHLGPFSRWLSVPPAKCPEAFSGAEGASSLTLKPGRESSPPTSNLGPCLFLILIPGTPTLQLGGPVWAGNDWVGGSLSAARLTQSLSPPPPSS